MSTAGRNLVGGVPIQTSATKCVPTLVKDTKLRGLKSRPETGDHHGPQPSDKRILSKKSAFYQMWKNKRTEKQAESRTYGTKIATKGRNVGVIWRNISAEFN